MPKKGERTRKIYALSHGLGVKPPKKWFSMMKKKSAKEYPKLGKKRLGKIVGGIWSKMSTNTKKKIVNKYQR